MSVKSKIEMNRKDKVSEILGIKISEVNGINEREVSPTSYYQVVRKGFPVESLVQVAKYYEIPKSQMAILVGTSERTIDRLKKKQEPLNPTASDRLYRFARLAARANEVFESAETARKWLKRPNRALEGVAPVDLLDTDAGSQQVDDLLTRIEYGVYS